MCSLALVRAVLSQKLTFMARFYRVSTMGQSTESGEGRRGVRWERRGEVVATAPKRS